jgi:hypothetical protein
MLTRFTVTTCPACGRSAKPTAQQPGNETVHGVLNAVPFAGTAYSAYRLSGAKLFCPHCGHQYPESLQEKARAALDQARALTSGSIAEEREACARIADSMIGAEARKAIVSV